MLAPAQAAALLHRRAADVLRGEDVIAARAVGRVLADQLAAEGYAQAYSSSADGIAVYRTGADPARVPYRDFRQELLPRVLDVLEEAASAALPGATRAAATARLVSYSQRGTESWLRTVTTVARELLPEMSTAEQDEIDALEKAARSASRPASPDAALLASSRRARREADEADSYELLRVWLPTLPGGRHALGDVWAAFQVARERSRDRLAESKPGALALGRTGFYSLVARLADVTSGGARSRYAEIPYQLRAWALLRRRNYAAALLLQRAHYAAAR